MAKFAEVDCLHLCWVKDKEILERLDEGGRVVKSADGASFVGGSVLNCLENRALLEPYMGRQRAARSLDIPDLESFKGQLKALHFVRASQRASNKGSKRPRAVLEATMEMVEGNSHLDAKSLKRMLSYARHRFLQDTSVKDTHLQEYVHGVSRH